VQVCATAVLCVRGCGKGAVKKRYGALHYNLVLFQFCCNSVTRRQKKARSVALNAAHRIEISYDEKKKCKIFRDFCHVPSMRGLIRYYVTS